ncbi:MAG: hypothetical protein HZC28_03470 [Spirochaetes bacterium]|nr:hypothetical protein [Spirochaetota bacterium]
MPSENATVIVIIDDNAAHIEYFTKAFTAVGIGGSFKLVRRKDDLKIFADRKVMREFIMQAEVILANPAFLGPAGKLLLELFKQDALVRDIPLFTYSADDSPAALMDISRYTVVSHFSAPESEKDAVDIAQSIKVFIDKRREDMDRIVVGRE